MTQLDGKSKDLINENIEKLKEIFPEVFSEGKIDFSKLEEELGNFKEKSDERYNFTWNGKSEAKKIALTPSTGTLRPCKEESKDWDTTQNLYIEGDNLEVLKLLQKSYHKKVKMIYIDPPYNTGKDFVYKDNFRDNIKNYLEITGQVDSDGNKLSTNSETNGRYHSDWLSMMYPRLKLARNLLKDDGVVFISIDDNEVANLRKLCDEIFGEDNFVNDLIWRKKTGASDAKGFSVITEYVLVYVKNVNFIEDIFTQNKNSFDPQRYKLSDEYETRRGSHYVDNLDRGGIQYSDSMNYGIECPDGTITYPNGRKEFFNDGWIWTWGKDKLKWGIENGFIVFKKSTTKNSGWGVYYKNYMYVNNKDELIERSAPHKNLILDFINTEGTAEINKLFESKVFQYTKPSNFIKELISFVNIYNDDLILDFFSGSATTAHAVMKLNSEDDRNRKFICVQLPETTDEKSEAYKAGYKNICEIGKERIRRAGEKVKSESGKDDLDIGFKVLKLDSSNIKSWDSDFENLETNLLDAVENIKDGRSEEDLLYEILLKYGLDLTLPINKPFENKNIYNIGFGALIICLDSNISIDITDDIIAIKKEYDSETTRVVLKDSGFKNATEKTNIIKTLNQNGIDEVVSV
ncbi:site-specific DNA-methyltransferase [Aliarcobacter lanthieri]|uniref:site-specific DNA-methyltransferase n=1 Tax=Aliarcobacter lanthieri TaxID=1355374 RepID=UPI003AAD6C5D